jgi:hypothetical protein
LPEVPKATASVQVQICTCLPQEAYIKMDDFNSQTLANGLWAVARLKQVRLKQCHNAIKGFQALAFDDSFAVYNMLNTHGGISKSPSVFCAFEYTSIHGGPSLWGAQ